MNLYEILDRYDQVHYPSKTDFDNLLAEMKEIGEALCANVENPDQLRMLLEEPGNDNDYPDQYSELQAEDREDQ